MIFVIFTILLSLLAFSRGQSSFLQLSMKEMMADLQDLKSSNGPDKKASSLLDSIMADDDEEDDQPMLKKDPKKDPKKSDSSLKLE